MLLQVEWEELCLATVSLVYDGAYHGMAYPRMSDMASWLQAGLSRRGSLGRENCNINVISWWVAFSQV